MESIAQTVFGTTKQVVNLKNKKILLGICGSIAAYKSAELARRLYEAGANIRVIMTAHAKQFISPLTLQALTQQPVRDNLWDRAAEAGMSHIELAKWADVLMVAPATANFLAKLAHGSADDLLSTVCLATKAPIVLLPAMNQNMWDSGPVRRNIQLLKEISVCIWGPADGKQACGDMGPGRMWEPERALYALEKLFSPDLWGGARIVITAGPTHESIDPVRYFSNYSSGKMGFALARAASLLGANVHLITGPVSLPTPWEVERLDVVSATDMLSVIQSLVEKTDVLISAAAIADYQPMIVKKHKIKKNKDPLVLTLTQTPDILNWLATLPKRPFTVGFAAETEQVKENAKKKLVEKSLDMVVANEVGPSKGFGSDHNEVTVLWPEGEVKIPYGLKEDIAKDIIAWVAQRYGELRGTH